jgi:RNA polymerase sigma-70 factor (ECF subfamily)
MEDKMSMRDSAISSLNIQEDFFSVGSDGAVEKRLVEAAKRGHSTAFAALCERHAKQLFRAAQNITRNHEDAEDAVQDALLSAFVHLRNFDGRSKFGTWLTRIAINSALMILRKKRNAPLVDLGGAEDSSTDRLNHEMPDRAPNPELHYAKREEARILNNAIKELRPALRDVVQKQQLQETSIRETAAAMGISEAAAKARLFHARVKLRKSSMLRMMRRTEDEQMCVLSAA